jgi:hypothetical protein
MSSSGESSSLEPKTNHISQQADKQTYSLSEAHRHFGVEANGRAWQLLEKEDRSRLEDDELLYAAHASVYHWLQVGKGVHQQRGEYLIAKVYLNLNLPEPALRHAQRCMQLTESHREQMADFDIAFAHEISARAFAISGDKMLAMKEYQLARQFGNEIQDVEDKRIFDSDFEGGNWYGIV